MRHFYRAASVALALSLALASGAFAGANASATLSQTSEAVVAEVGPGESVSIAIEVDGMVDAKRALITIQLSDPASFDTGNITVQPGGAAGTWLAVPGLPVSGTTDQFSVAAASQGGAATSGTGSFTINLVTAADTEASVTVTEVQLTDTANEVDSFTNPGIALTINPPVTDPTLVASGATDRSLDFSAVGSGNVADGSDGETGLGVVFADETGAAASGQAIAWVITNNGAESIYVLGADVTEVQAGSTAQLETVTGADGSAILSLDAEGDHFAGSTNASVTASTTAPNSDGDILALTVGFSVTWDVPVPAELASFAGQVTMDHGIELQWLVASQTNNLGWEVYRSTDNVSFERVGDLVPGDGTVDVARQYTFLDEDLPASDVVYYYLRQLDLNGAATRSQVIEVALAPTAVNDQSLPLVTALNQNYPNPFNPETSIRFDLAEGSTVRLRVYDTTGQVVRTLLSGHLPAGSYTERWDGLNESGAKVGSGVYFYELRAGSYTSMKKMTLLQ